MSDEIKFYGIGGKSKASVILSPAASGELRPYGVYLPNASTLSLDELDRVDPNLFPWPMNVSVPRQGDPNSKPTLINSISQLREFLDDTRDPAALINFSLPPQAPEEDVFKGVYAYVGADYTFVHNTTLDKGFMINSNNTPLFDRIGLDKDKVLRLTRGLQGWFYDSIFSKNQDCLAPIYANCLAEMNRDDNFSLFQSGYKAGFFGQSQTWNINAGTVSPAAHLGDPYTFGFYTGGKFRSEINQVAGYNNTIDKHLMLRLKVVCSDDEFNSKLGLIQLHNNIISGDHFNSAEVIRHLNPKCLIHIPNSTMLCGEGGHYCSGNCSENAHVSRSSFQHTVNHACHLILESHTKAGDYPAETIIIPEDISSMKADMVWNGKDTQFRIIVDDTEKIQLRFQSKDIELQHKITCGSEIFSAIALKEIGRAEFDISIKLEKLGMSTQDFSAFKGVIRQAKFNNPSQYSGSGQKYASLIHTQEGFALEDGTLVIPNKIFIKYLEKHKNVKLNLVSNLTNNPEEES